MSSINTSGEPWGGGWLLAITDNPWIILAIVIISAISSWVQSRNKKREEQEQASRAEDFVADSTGSDSATEATKPMKWEEELKRLLEGQQTAEPPPAPPPIPVMVKTSATPVDRVGGSQGDEFAPHETPAQFRDSAAAFERTTRWHEAMADRMRQINELTEKHDRPVRTAIVTPRHSLQTASAEARAAVALVRRPGSVRQAVIASIVLGPPRAFEI